MLELEAGLECLILQLRLLGAAHFEQIAAWSHHLQRRSLVKYGMLAKAGEHCARLVIQHLEHDCEDAYCYDSQQCPTEDMRRATQMLMSTSGVTAWCRCILSKFVV